MIKINIDKHKNLIIINIIGKFFIDSISPLEEIWIKEIEKKPETIAINCSRLDLIDSTAIGTLVQFLKIAKAKKINLIFYDLNETIKILFETTCLNNFFTIKKKKKFIESYKDDLKKK